jgi:hypothetical protein
MAEAEDLGDTVALMLESLALSESSLRCTLTWAGAEYPCTAGPAYRGKRIDEGGWRAHAQLKVKVRTVLFPEGVGFPQEKQTVQVKLSANGEARRYRIDAVTNYYDAVLLLECEDPAQGA